MIHPELKTILNSTPAEFSVPNAAVLKNAQAILGYIEDINLERNNKFELTADESLYLLWEIGESELHIECLKSGKILYTFRKYGIGKACGSCPANEFMQLLEKYLLTAIC